MKNLKSILVLSGLVAAGANAHADYSINYGMKVTVKSGDGKPLSGMTVTTVISAQKNAWRPLGCGSFPKPTFEKCWGPKERYSEELETGANGSVTFPEFKETKGADWRSPFVQTAVQGYDLHCKDKSSGFNAYENFSDLNPKECVYTANLDNEYSRPAELVCTIPATEEEIAARVITAKIERCAQ